MKRSGLLINPNAGGGNAVMPLGLAYIAAYLMENSVRTGVIDAWAENLSPHEVANRVKELEPDIVGITITSPNYQAAASLFKPIRSVKPDCKIVVGGPHPSALPVKTLAENPEIDVAVVGEGELTMLRLLAAFEEGGDLSFVEGIAHKKGEEVVLNKGQQLLADIDSLPFPARRLFPLSRYKTHPPYSRKKPYMSLITTRGWLVAERWSDFDLVGNSVVQYTGLDKAEIESAIERSYRQFYLRPSYMLKRLIKVRNLAALRNMLLSFKNFVVNVCLRSW